MEAKRAELVAAIENKITHAIDLFYGEINAAIQPLNPGDRHVQQNVRDVVLRGDTLSHERPWSGDRRSVKREGTGTRMQESALDLDRLRDSRGGTNALDREYEPVLGFPAPGRTFVGGVRTSW